MFSRALHSFGSPKIGKTGKRRFAIFSPGTPPLQQAAGDPWRGFRKVWRDARKRVRSLCAGASGKPDAAIDPTLDNVVTILRNALDARITDTVRPQNASYGALHSWHKVGQAVDFVPRAGLQSVNRDQIRTLFAAHSIRLLELLGPGDPGHANHWHVAFATEQQDPNDDRPLLRDENWIVTADARGSAPPIFLGPKRLPRPPRPLNRPNRPRLRGTCLRRPNGAPATELDHDQSTLEKMRQYCGRSGTLRCGNAFDLAA
jgi:hypothetical protein